MSLLTDASLIVTPNAYKAGTLYSVVPNTALGDMDVSRATSATRVDSAGLIEIARTNLVLQSQTLDNGSWSKTISGTGIAPVVTANAGTAPDGTMTADRVQFNCVGSLSADRSLLLQGSLVTTITTRYYQSIYVKAFSSGEVGKKLRIASDGLTGSSSVITITADWQRIVLNGLANAVTTNFIVETRGTFTTPTNTTADVLLWGAQLEAGSNATDYIPTIASIRTKFADITQDGSVGANIPRIDYPPLGGCPSILVEPARTNLVLYSEEFDNVSWLKTATTVTANTTTSPDETTTADTVTGIGAIGPRLIQSNSISFTTGTSYSLSVFAKKGTNDFIQLFVPLIIGGMSANFNINTGVVGTLATVSGTAPTSSIINYGNGWYRCTMNFTATTTTSTVTSISIVTSASAARSESNTLTTSIILWGAQAEAGTSPTSYIPTVASQLQRNADVISKTGVTTLIGQTEGTLYAEVNLDNFDVSNVRILAISDGTSANRIMILTNSSNRITTIATNSSVEQTQISSGTLAKGLYKIAVTYALNDFAFYINGALIGVDTSITVPICTDVYLGKIETSSPTGILNDRIELAALFKTALTDDQCILLTGVSFSTYPEMANALIYTIQ